MSKAKDRFTKAQRMASLAAGKANEKMKELSKIKKEEIQPKLKSTFNKV